MRSTILSFTLMTALGVAPAFAQTGYSQDQDQGQNMPSWEVPAPPQHVPLVRHPTNITPQTTHSIISPAVPQPPIGPNADATQYLQVAIWALHNHRGGEAQSALGDAETYLLNRAVPYGQVNQPDQSPAVQTIHQAVQALGDGNYERSAELARQAIPLARQQEAAFQGQGSQMGMYQSGPMQGQGGMASPYGPPPSGQGYGNGYAPPPNGYGMNQGYNQGYSQGYNQAGMQPGTAPGYGSYNYNGQYNTGYGYNNGQPGMGYGNGYEPGQQPAAR